MTIIGILLALIAALSIQAVLSAGEKNASLQEVLAQWIRSQDAFAHWMTASSKNDEMKIVTSKTDDEKIVANKKDEEKIVTRKTDDEKIVANKKDDEKIIAHKNDDEKIVANKNDDEVVAKEDVSLQMDVVKWVRENGGYFNPKQEFRRVVPGDSSSPFGIFATDRIEEGEMLVSVPWKCIMTAGTDDWETYMHCDTTRFIIDEMRKGNDSFYGPYIQYLLSAPPVNIPSTWSKKGKQLLKEITGAKQLPPKRATSWLKYWYDECDGKDDPFEIQAAMQLVTRGDDDTLAPVYDMYNHRNGQWLNTRHSKIEDVKQEMFASKTIEKDEQIYLCKSSSIRL